jgi:CBS domain-containing protein
MKIRSATVVPDAREARPLLAPSLASREACANAQELAILAASSRHPSCFCRKATAAERASAIAAVSRLSVAVISRTRAQVLRSEANIAASRPSATLGWRDCARGTHLAPRRHEEQPMLVEQLIEHAPRCLTTSDTAQSAARLMRDENIGFVPVCDDDGRMIGVVTDRDITVRIVAGNLSPLIPLGALITRHPVVCRARDEMSVVEAMMAKERLSRIVCVDDEVRPIGVISLADIAWHRGVARAGALLRDIVGREISGGDAAQDAGV